MNKYLSMGFTELDKEIRLLSTPSPKIPKIRGDKEELEFGITDGIKKVFFSILEHNDFSSVVKVIDEIDCWI